MILKGIVLCELSITFVGFLIVETKICFNHFSRFILVFIMQINLKEEEEEEEEATFLISFTRENFVIVEVKKGKKRKKVEQLK